MNIKQFFRNWGYSSKEPRFGLIFQHNTPATDALIVINNRNRTFHNVKAQIINKKNEQFETELNLQNKEAALISLHDFSQKTNPLKSKNISKVIIQYDKSKFSFVPDGNTFKLIN